MFQPGTYNDGVLGAIQPGAYRDGTLGVLSQPGAFRDGTLGVTPIGPSTAYSAAMARAASQAAQARAAAARGAAYSADMARRAHFLALRRSSHMRDMRGLGFALSDVPTWGWIAGGVAVAAGAMYLLKK